MSVLVLGSFMMDHVVTTDKVPQEGETLIGEKFDINPGGKGINQAVSARRLGSEVEMLGMLGNDPHGEMFLKIMEKEDIKHDNIVKNDYASTGVGCITKETNGNNRIVVVPGANMLYNIDNFKQSVLSYDKINVFLTQFEVPYKVVDYALKNAHSKGITTILNPAPAREIATELYNYIDFLTPNETELEALTHVEIHNIEDVKKASRILIDKGVRNVIVTLGDKGSILVNSEISHFFPPYSVDVIDTVGAGDSFNGALAASISRGLSLKNSLEIANAAGALTVTKEGAIYSLPSHKEVIDFINTYKQKENKKN